MIYFLTSTASYKPWCFVSWTHKQQNEMEGKNHRQQIFYSLELYNNKQPVTVCLWFTNSFREVLPFSKTWSQGLRVCRRLSAKIESTRCELRSRMKTSVSRTATKGRKLPCTSVPNHILALILTLSRSWPQPALVSQTWNPKMKAEMMSPVAHGCYQHHFLALIFGGRIIWFVLWLFASIHVSSTNMQEAGLWPPGGDQDDLASLFVSCL